MSGSASLDFIIALRGDALRAKHKSYAPLRRAIAVQRRLQRDLRDLEVRRAPRKKLQAVTAQLKMADRTVEEEDSRHAQVVDSPRYALRLTGSQRAAWDTALDDLVRMTSLPKQHLSNYIIREGSDGRFHVYFGGDRKPNGPNHGHCVIDALKARVVLMRMPHEPRSRGNYTDQPLRAR